MVSFTSKRLTSNAGSIQQRLEKCSSQPENQQCADCGDENPSWASILVAPVLGGRKMGIFCCSKCCRYHIQLGRRVCEVKNLRAPEDWAEDEVKALETSGNEIANAIYEGTLGKDQKPNGQDYDAQARFVSNKYKGRKFFCKKTYDSHGSWFSLYKEPQSIHLRSFQQAIAAEDSDDDYDDDHEEEQEETGAGNKEGKAQDLSSKVFSSFMEVKRAVAVKTVCDTIPSDDDLGYNTPDDLGYGSTGDEVTEGNPADAGAVDRFLTNQLASRSIGRRSSANFTRRRSSCGRGGRRGSMGDNSRRAGRRSYLARSEHSQSPTQEGSPRVRRCGRRRSSVGVAPPQSTNSPEGLGEGSSPRQPRIRRNISSQRRSVGRRASTGMGASLHGDSAHLEATSSHSRGEVSPHIEHHRQCRKSFRRSNTLDGSSSLHNPTVRVPARRRRNSMHAVPVVVKISAAE